MKKEKKKTPWTDQELKELIQDAPNKTSNRISTNLNRTIYDVEKKAKSLGIEILKINTANEWSDSEMNKLNNIAYRHTISELVSMFPGRTYNSIWRVVTRHKITVKSKSESNSEGSKDKVYEVNPESKNAYLIRRIEELTKRRDEVFKRLNGEYNKELYTELNNLNVSLEKLKKQ